MQSPHRTLDEAVDAVSSVLEGDGVTAPEAFLLMATGASLFAERLADVREVELSSIAGVPPPWSGEVLFTGTLGDLPVWLATDVSGEPVPSPPGPAWTSGFLLWLAAAHGATVCVHTSAGSALARARPGESSDLAAGGFALIRDHINLSGASPLIGLGESRLGPLFPDLSVLHHLGLRRAALERAESLGIPSAEAIAACTAGPALETPAERRMFARAGADVSVQGLAPPLLAAAHAGLACLAIVAIADTGEDPADVEALLQSAAVTQPALDDLLVALAPDLEKAVAVLGLENNG